MKKILYIGNALSKKGKTITSVETLGRYLEDYFTVIIASRKENMILRMYDMIMHLIIHRKNLEYVLIDTYSTKNFYYALIISQGCRLFKLPYILILRGGNLESRLVNSPKLSKRIFKNATELIAPSNFLKDVFLKYGYDKVKYIPNTIDIKRYNFQDRKIGTIKLLWVRSFSEIYNPKLAVYVLKKLLDEGYEAELCMVGPEVDGNLERTKALANTLKTPIKFTGKLDKDTWIKLSDDYNIFLNTTNFDNTPISVMEAMALGLPVISTNVGGLPFLIKDNEDGILINSNDIDAMVSAIINLSNNSKYLQAMVKNARKKVENFDWKIIKQQWIEILK